MAQFVTNENNEQQSKQWWGATITNEIHDDNEQEQPFFDGFVQAAKTTHRTAKSKEYMKADAMFVVIFVIVVFCVSVCVSWPSKYSLLFERIHAQSHIHIYTQV